MQFEMVPPKSDTDAFLPPFSAAALLPAVFGQTAKQLDFQVYLGLSLVSAVLTPCFRRGSVQRYGILALQVYFTAQAYFAPVKPSESLAIVYTSGVLLGNLTLRYLDRLYLQAPEDDFYRVDDRGAEEKSDALTPVQKLWWSAELFLVTRGVGWNWRISGMPKSPGRTRATFVFGQAVRWVTMYASVWAVERVCASILDEWTQLPDGLVKSGLLAISHNTAFLYVFIVLVFSLTVYTHFEMLSLPLSLLCVGLELGPTRWRHPEAWPATFGSLGEAYSLRRFWSHSWHQQLRRTLGVASAFFVSLLPGYLRTSPRFPVRLFRRYFSLILVFALSGAFHTTGLWTVLRARRSAGDDDARFRDWGEMPFFLAQGVGIMLEDFACYVLGVEDRRGASRARVLVGYIATAAFYGWTRVHLKAFPMTRIFGIKDERGPLFEALELARVGLAVIPGNFVKMGLEGLLP